MKKATVSQIENLKRLHKEALSDNSQSNRKGVFTHFLQILKDIDSISTFHQIFSLEYIQLDSPLIPC